MSSGCVNPPFVGCFARILSGVRSLADLETQVGQIVTYSESVDFSYIRRHEFDHFELICSLVPVCENNPAVADVHKFVNVNAFWC